MLLFDIDGTLLRTRGAGRQALDEAFFETSGWASATDGVPMAGSTDGAIVEAVRRRFPGGFDLDALQAAYYARLARCLAEPGRAEACPGVQALLAAVEGRAHLALLTGNWRAGAELKLASVGLGGRFFVGAFGDDAVDRNALVPVARARAAAAGLEVARVIVIGDTPADVECARAGGALAVVVETGFSTPADLARCRPDLQLVDLARGRDWLLALLGATEPGRRD